MTRQNKRGQKAVRGARSKPPEGGTTNGPKTVSSGAGVRTAWPDEFASPKAAIAIVGTLLMLGGVLFGLAYFNHLLWLKVILGYLIGLFDPAYVQPTSWDLAIVLWGLALAVGAGCVHPCFGLIVLALFRPWLDGYTFPTDNMYFLWGILVFFALCGARSLFRGEAIRFGIPILLLAGFCAVGTLTLASSLQFNRSFRELLLWFSYLALFLVSSNTLRNRTTIGLVLVGIAVAMAAETVFSLLHYHYMLPYLRRIVQDPQVLRYFFETDQVTPELARRLNVNRAFGSMLFPNALAGFLILGIPFSIAGAILGWRSLVEVWRSPAAQPRKESHASRRYRAVAVGAVTWLAATCAVFTMAQFPLTFNLAEAGLDKVPWFAHTHLLAGLAAAIGLAPAAILFWFANRGGLALCGRVVWAVGLSKLAVLEVLALVLTFSRGGMLALFFALTAGTALFVGSPWLSGKFSRRRSLRYAAKAVLVCALLGGLSVGLLAGPPTVTAQEASTPQTTSDSAERGDKGLQPLAVGEKKARVTDEGIMLKPMDMLELSSFKLRLSYWRVGFIMLRHHFWTGVGLGNFGLAYPRYQYLGAGDVREAHNSILQAFCETGVWGGMFLTAFCAYLLLWGAWHILREHDWKERLLLAGLFTGILAFFLHALIDIHFSHPSLMMFCMLWCGIFCARVALAQSPGAAPGKAPGGNSDPEVAKSPEQAHGTRRLLYQLVALPLLAFAAAAVGMSMRVYLQDLALSRVGLINVADRKEMTRRYHTARFVRQECTTLMRKKSGKSARRPVAYLLPLFPDVNTLASFGRLYEPMPGTARGARPIQNGEQVPPDAFIVITNPRRALNRGYEAGTRCVAELETIDSRFPHDPEVAMHLQQWYELLILLAMPNVNLHDKVPAYRSEALRWSEEAVRRSPMHADLHLNYAQALWRLAGVEAGMNNMNYALDALEQYRLATVLTSTMPLYFNHYGYALGQVGNACRAMGDEEKAQKYLQSADEMRLRAKTIDQERIRLGLG